jgi:hypothetical protein
MFLLDSLMISGISWALKTALTAAEAEMNDDTALREQLLAAEMQREMGEITDDDYAEVERDLLARIREIKERRDGGSGPLAFGDGEPIESTDDSRFQIEATVSGDFHHAADAPHTTIVETEPAHGRIVGTQTGQTLSVLDIEPVRAETLQDPALPLPAARRPKRAATSSPHSRGTRAAGTVRTRQARKTPRTSRTTSRSKMR